MIFGCPRPKPLLAEGGGAPGPIVAPPPPGATEPQRCLPPLPLRTCPPLRRPIRRPRPAIFPRSPPPSAELEVNVAELQRWRMGEEAFLARRQLEVSIPVMTALELAEHLLSSRWPPPDYAVFCAGAWARHSRERRFVKW